MSVEMCWVTPSVRLEGMKARRSQKARCFQVRGAAGAVGWLVLMVGEGALEDDSAAGDENGEETKGDGPGAVAAR